MTPPILNVLKLELLATASIPQMALSCNWHVLISKGRTTHTYFTPPSNLLSCTVWSLEENTKMYQNKGSFKITVIQDMMQCSMVYRYQRLRLPAAASNHKRMENQKLRLQFLSSWWWAVCPSKHVEQLRNIGIINSTTRLHLVGYFCMIYKIIHLQIK